MPGVANAGRANRLRVVAEVQRRILAEDGGVLGEIDRRLAQSDVALAAPVLVACVVSL